MATQEVATTTSQAVEYTPWGDKDSIKLTAAIVKKLLCAPTKKGALCSDDDAMKFIMMCRSRLLNPFAGDAFLIGYDSNDGPKFTLITAHQAYLKRAELHPEFNGMESGVVVTPAEKCNACDGKGMVAASRCPICDGRGTNDEVVGDIVPQGKSLVGGWSKVSFKSRAIPMKKRVKLETFKKPYGIWTTDSAGMIVKCAEADGLRSSFPTMLGGLLLREEVESQVIEVEAFKPQRSKLVASAMPAIATTTAATTATAAQPAAQPPPVAKEKAVKPKQEPAPQPELPPQEPPKPPAEQPTRAPLEAEAAALRDWADSKNIPEEAICSYICMKYHLSPCDNLATLEEIAPRRVIQVYEAREELLQDILDTLPA